MFVIYGTKPIRSKLSQGNFHCPECNSDTQYTHRKAKKFFHLYWIPIIPLGTLGEYVECGRCDATFDPRILQHDPNESDDLVVAEFYNAVKMSMVLMMLADGVIDENEKKGIQIIYKKLTGIELNESDIEQAIQEAQSSSYSLMDYLNKVGYKINTGGKEMILKSVIMIASADGEISDEEVDLITEIGKALEMSGTHMKSIFKELS